MKKLVYLLLLVGGLSEINCANAAQPGIWSAGGAVYTLLLTQDRIPVEAFSIYLA